MLKLRSAQLVRVKKPNLFNDLKKGVFLPEQSNTSQITVLLSLREDYKTTLFLVKLGMEMGVAMGGALKC